MFRNLRRSATHEVSGFQGLYQTESLHENANARTHPGLAVPGYYSQGPHMIIEGIPEKPLLEVPDEIYSPTRTENSEESDPFYAVGNTGYVARTNPELAKLVAKLDAEDHAAERQQSIKKVVIPMGEKSLLLAAASL